LQTASAARPDPGRAVAFDGAAARRRPWLAVVLAVALGSCGVAAADRGGITAVPLPAGEVPARLGELELLGAFELRSGDPDFGGISGARFDGRHLLLLSDRSRLFELDWPDPPPTVARTLPILSEEPLTDPAGRPLDAEALALAPGGERLIGDESGSRVFAFPPGRAGAGELRWRLPAVFASGAARNQGIEALATLPDGVLLAVGEGATGDEGRHPAALRSRSGTVRVREFASDGGLDPTDAVAIGPWLLILERRPCSPAGTVG
jgi:hypothetical protein